MGRIHERIEQLGRQGALALPELDVPNYRMAFEAAHSFMTDEDPRTGFLFSGWCQTALPHSRLADDEVWILRTDYVSLMVEPGNVQVDGRAVKVGVPFGSRARLILLFLQSEAVRTRSREIELGKSLRAWLKRLGVPVGGRSMNDVREQALRISRCRMTFQVEGYRSTGFLNQNLVDTAMFTHERDGPLLNTVRLSETFYEALTKHPVPLQESAIRAIANNSQALDIYCWLAYRLHVLEKPYPITWKALHAQFGTSYAKIKNFRIRFIDSLQIALAVYPEAHVDVEKEGLTLHPSRSPVPPRKAAIPHTPGRSIV